MKRRPIKTSELGAVGIGNLISAAHGRGLHIASKHTDVGPKIALLVGIQGGGARGVQRCKCSLNLAWALDGFDAGSGLWG